MSKATIAAALALPPTAPTTSGPALVITGDELAQSAEELYRHYRAFGRGLWKNWRDGGDGYSLLAVILLDRVRARNGTVLERALNAAGGYE